MKMRPKIGSLLVKLASRVDKRPNVSYEIVRHDPEWCAEVRKGLARPVRLVR